MLQDELSKGLNIIAKEQERRAGDVNPPVTVRARPASDAAGAHQGRYRPIDIDRSPGMIGSRRFNGERVLQSIRNTRKSRPLGGGCGCRLICQSGANESPRPTCSSATGPAGAHDTPAAGHNFTADSATIRSVARAYDGPAAHLPGRQRPQRGNPAPPDPRHPPLGHSVDPPADRLPDPHATAAPAHPRAGRQPGFELRFEPWPWPQHQLPPCRFAAIAVRHRPSRSIDVSHASKIRPLRGRMPRELSGMPVMDERCR